MSDPQYYRLELDDVSAPSFTSFGKFYYGTINEIKGFIDALDAADYTGDHAKDLIHAFYANSQGQTNVTHSVAYREVPLLKEVRLIHEENLILPDYSWEHLNIWGYLYYMRCSKVERLGHERVQTTMETYSHLYPNKQTEVAAQLDVIATKDDGYEKTS